MKINSKNLLLCFFLFFASVSFLLGQSKFEFGIGIAINHSKINEDIKTQFGPGENGNKGIRLLGLSTRIGYKFSDRVHLNSGAGISWLGSLRKDLSARVVASTFELPIQLEWNPWKHFQISSGPTYNYIIGIDSEVEGEKFDRLPAIKSRHQIGLRHSISYSYELIELTLGYTHYMTDLFNQELTDVNGNSIGTLVSKLQNIQIGIIVRR